MNNICTKCQFDVRLNGNGFEEFKSYKEISIAGISSSATFFNQFKTYFSQISSIDNLSYIFNVEKVNDPSYIKPAFKKMLYSDTNAELTTKGTALFDVIWGSGLGLRESIWINTPTPMPTNPDDSIDKPLFRNRFASIVSDLNNDIYNFIKVK